MVQKFTDYWISYQYRANNALSGQYWHRQILPITQPINDAYTCKLWLCKAVLVGATWLATGEKDTTVTHKRSATPGKRNTRAFILAQALVQFDH